MAPVPAADPAAKKPGSRASKRVESMRAHANTQAVRTVFRVFNGKEDSVLRGVDAKEDLLTLARVTNRVKAALPARALADKAVVPLRTRGQHLTDVKILLARTCPSIYGLCDRNREFDLLTRPL